MNFFDFRIYCLLYYLSQVPLRSNSIKCIIIKNINKGERGIKMHESETFINKTNRKGEKAQLEPKKR